MTKVYRCTVVYLFAVIATVACFQGSGFAEEPSAQPLGTLMMFGGAQRLANATLWSEFARLARGRQGRVAVFPTAFPEPAEIDNFFVPHLRSLGLEPFVVPASPFLKQPDYRQIVVDPAWVARVRDSDAVYLCGGDQARYRKVLMDAEGRETPLLQAIRHVYNRGGLVAGSSAGTAVMSRLMFIDGEALRVMQNGARLGSEVERGFGLMPENWMVDQHFLVRGRLGRMLVAMQSHRLPFGIGIDENTAFVVEKGRQGRVVGERGVIVADASSAEADPAEARFDCRNVALHFLSHGDTIDLDTRRVVPGREKRNEHRVDFGRPDFKPTYPLKQFYSDILANMRVKELMYKLVDSPHDEAFGLAFDASAARTGPTEGFEFRFYRNQETTGWASSEAPGDPHTIVGVRLDIRPVRFSGPLYR